MKKLLKVMPQTGTVEWIGLRPEKRAMLVEVDEVEVSLEKGLVGDRYRRAGGNRQVTLIQSEHLRVVASILKKEKIDPQLTRRNIVISGINLHALKGQAFKIGETVVLQCTSLCHPCSRMEENLGPGGYNAMRNHGGICCKVVEGGMIRKGDGVKLLK